ncbi:MULTISPECIES: type VII secretion protein EccB [unclassified Streptomyces]|uniref:type VII secretion protein EccB n=1 Tax=unclassified Streptomyces TaxID=2593676 RepID=UPI001907FE0C|nr:MULTISPECIES: type VII secretion protein EccB [unclassified Streptomyces]MCU4750088.1 type VII secretion protein EccB [Streptomyces sp. G-5]QQN76908.1 type VII secretion protein EccB [Streptomyces sp. XC 2026]
MASRKDELNAYTYAKKRRVAAFVQPSPTGSDEGAPRPLRAVVPGMVVGALVLAGFGAWGMFKPAVPAQWDKPNKNVIIGSESTTRYVVLTTDGRDQLHPVLNLSSARLLLDPDSFDIVSVNERELDNGRIPHGATLGIPYAPDRLPSADDAGRAKRWAVCQRPGGSGGAEAGHVQQAVFVLGDRDADRVEGGQRLRDGQVLYVASTRDQARYLVDGTGTKYLIGGPDWADMAEDETELLHRSLVGSEHDPQPVTEEWLATLNEGSPIVFPQLEGTIGESAGVPGLDPDTDRVGMVLLAPTGAGPQHYVVLPGKVVPVSEFTARLLLDSPDAGSLGQASAALEVGAQTFTPAPAADSIDRDHDWPAAAAEQVNALAGDDTPRETVCSVLRGVDEDDGSTELSTWAGTGYPATIVNEAGSAYVTPGSGLLYRQVQGEQAEAGGVYLVTDTGLRYAVDAGATTDKSADDAQIRLGYRDVTPVPVPAHWSQFLPVGPRLDRASAQQPQGS